MSKFCLLQLGHDDYSVNLSLLDRRYFHIILEQIGEICIGIMRRGEHFPFKFDLSKREDRVATMIDAISVAHWQVAHVLTRVAEQAVEFQNG